jgi:hypothetical protein
LLHHPAKGQLLFPGAAFSGGTAKQAAYQGPELIIGTSQILCRALSPVRHGTGPIAAVDLCLNSFYDLCRFFFKNDLLSQGKHFNDCCLHLVAITADATSCRAAKTGGGLKSRSLPVNTSINIQDLYPEFKNRIKHSDKYFKKKRAFQPFQKILFPL